MLWARNKIIDFYNYIKEKMKETEFVLPELEDPEKIVLRKRVALDTFNIKKTEEQNNELVEEINSNLSEIREIFSEI